MRHHLILYRFLCAGTLLLAASPAIRAQGATPSSTPAAPAPAAAATSQSDTARSGDEVIQLNPFQVSESSDVGYGADETATTSRVKQAYIDVPQTVNVMTAEYLRDYNIQDERALLQYVPNLLLGFGDTNGRVIRASQVNATYTDGLLQLSTTIQSQPMEFYDRVEIVKGPTSAGFGVGEPGGIINYVSKVPQGVNRTDVSFGIGDYGNYRATLDTQGVSPQSSKLSYRLNAFWDQGNYIKDEWAHKGAGTELALRYDVDRNTSVQLIVAYSDTTSPNQNDVLTVWENRTVYTVWRTLTGDAYPALPGTNNNPHNTVQDWATGQLLPSTAEPLPDGWSGFNDQLFTTELFLDRSLLNDHIHIRNGFEIVNNHFDFHDSSEDGLYINPAGFAPGYYTGIDRYRYTGQAWGIQDDLDILGRFQFGPFSSQTLAGITGAHATSENTDYLAAAVGPNGQPDLENIYTPDRTPWQDPPSGRYYFAVNTGRGFSYGYYVQEDLGLLNDHIVASAGWREDYEHSYTYNFLTGPSGTYNPGWQNNGGVPRYSITIKPVKWLSFYELFSQHADPSQSAQKYFFVSGDLTPALEAKYNNFQDIEHFFPGGKLVESGAKASFLNGKLIASFAFFHEINTGQVFGRVAEEDLGSNGSVTEVGTNLISGVNAHGYEWEIFGQATPRLTFVVNYGQTKGHYPDFEDGNPHWWSQAPTLMGHGRYDFGNLHGKGLYITFGGQYFWGFWEYQDPYVWFRAGQYSVDGGIGYKWDRGHQSLYLNDNNFTRQTVIVGNTDTVPWTALPREQGFLTYSYSFF